MAILTQDLLRKFRTQIKLKDLFSDRINVKDIIKDVKNYGEPKDGFYTRAIVALVIAMRCHINYDSAFKIALDKSAEFDAVYVSKDYQKITIVGAYWGEDNNEYVSEKVSCFINSFMRLARLASKSFIAGLTEAELDIVNIICNTDYKIELVFCHSTNCAIDESYFSLNNEFITFTEINLEDIHKCLMKI